MQNGYKEKNSQGNFTTFDRKSQETEDHLNENNQQYFIKRIGRTNFKVNVFFSETEKETPEDKILRLQRIIITVQMRSQIFRQTKPKAEVILCVLPSILAKYDGKYASRCVAIIVRWSLWNYSQKNT